MNSRHAMRPLAAWLGLALLSASVETRALMAAPPDVDFMAASRSLSEACAAFAGTALGEILCGPPFDPLRQELMRGEIAAPMNLAPMLGVSWSDLATTDQPGALLAFVLPDRQIGVALLLPRAASHAACIEVARKAFEARGFQAQRELIGAADATIYYSQRGQTGGGATRAVLRGDGYDALVSSHEAAVQLAARHLNSALSALNELTQAAGSPSQVEIFVRPWELAEAATTPADATKDPLAAAKRVGWVGVKAIRGTVQPAGGRDGQMLLDLELNAPQPFQQAVQLLSFVPGSAPPPLPSSVPQDVRSVLFLRWDFPRAMQGFATLFDDASEPGPAGVGLFDDLLLGLLEDPEGPQVDLRRDVFAELGPAVWCFAQPDEAGGPRHVLYDIQVRDHAKVHRALSRYYAGDDRVTHSESDGFETWTVAPGSSLFVEGEGESVITIRALALGADRMLVATDDAIVRAALAQAGTSESPAAEAWSAAGWGDDAVQGCLWALSDLDDAWRGAYEQAVDESAASPTLMAQAWRVLLVGSDDPKSRAALAHAPAYEALRPALGWGRLSLSAIDDGFRLQVHLTASDSAAGQP